MEKPWLINYPWAVVEQLNANLCEKQKKPSEPSAEGYSEAKSLWEAAHQVPMSIADMASLGYRCHRLAPFKFFNGNTFVAVCRDALSKGGFSTQNLQLLKTFLGHTIAGTITQEEEEAFRRLITTLDTDNP